MTARPLRIAFALHEFPPECAGGTERVAEAIALELQRLGHEVHVISGTLELGAPGLPTRGTHAGIPVTRLHRNDLFFDAWDKGWHPGIREAFRAELERIRPDVLHVHHWIRLSRDLVRVAAEAGIPSVVSLHDFTVTCPRVFRIDRAGKYCGEPRERAPCLTCAPRHRFQGDREIGLALALQHRDFVEELRAASLVLAPTRAHGATVARLLGADWLRIEALPNPAARVLRPAPRRAADATLRIAHWGWFYDLKGTHLLLRAVRAARGRERMRVTLLGRAPHDDYARQLRAEAEGLAVEFLGPYGPDDLERVVADVAAIPTSCEESYGLVLDEAFMLGLPVVASDVAAFRERGGGGAHLVPVGDTGALAAALDRALDEPQFLAGLRARIPVSWTTVEATGSRLLELYAEVLGGLRRPLPPLAPISAAERASHEHTLAELRFESLFASGDAGPPPEGALPG